MSARLSRLSKAVAGLTVRPELVEACPEPGRRGRTPPMLRQAQHERNGGAAVCRILAGVPILLIRIYRWCVSPLLPPSCRFHPSCSQYALEAYQQHGLLRGTGLSLWRI